VTTTESEDLRYPVGTFRFPENVSASDVETFLTQIEETPKRLREAVSGLDDEQLDTPYRPDGWTVRQVVHHVADSHLNSYSRFKFAVAEDVPTIKAYDEARWAEFEDARTGPTEPSLALLEALHDRWVRFLRSLTPEERKRTFRHPELGIVSVEQNIALYAWHGRHHVAHITRLRDRQGWT
jgi:uncharacterized damage-inducible protein DinB